MIPAGDRPALADPTAGAGIVRLDTAATAVFVVTAVLGAVAGEGPAVTPLVVVSLVSFAGGLVAFLGAYAVAVNRSRTDAIGMGGLFFLADSAPPPVRQRMLGLWVAQLVVAVVVASVRIYTAVAFALLAPMLGIGLMGLWGARHGAFPPRRVKGAGDRP